MLIPMRIIMSNHRNNLTNVSDTEQLVTDLSALCNNQETSDVIFIVGDQELVFHAHKLILWARCHSFQKYQQQFWRSRTSHGPLTFKYPQYRPDIFALVLKYVYSSHIILTDQNVFPVLALSKEFGILSLTSLCEKQVISCLTPQNACSFLAAALEMQSTTPESDVDRNFVSECMHYIEQHAAQCVKTEGWLDLPKQALISLISSEDFRLEEENVWRAVIEWAKSNSGVIQDKKPSEWSSQEKVLIGQSLAGIIEHIKFLLIDSKVFAEEVEPSGVIPIQLSLERYKTAALPQPEHITDKRLQPRVGLQYFLGSTILTKDSMHFQRTLNQWYGEPKQTWRVLYHAAEDGFSAASFHKFCDGQAPTFVIIKSSSGNICGGFSDVPWTSSTPPRGRFYPSHRSFLFTLVNNQEIPPSKYDVKNSKYATLHHADYGPMFGAGADLCIADNCNKGMESYSNLPHSYDGQNASCSILMGDYNFTVYDYEVFTVDKHEMSNEV